MRATGLRRFTLRDRSAGSADRDLRGAGDVFAGGGARDGAIAT